MPNDLRKSHGNSGTCNSGEISRCPHVWDLLSYPLQDRLLYLGHSTIKKGLLCLVNHFLIFGDNILQDIYLVRQQFMLVSLGGGLKKGKRLYQAQAALQVVLLLSVITRQIQWCSKGLEHRDVIEKMQSALLAEALAPRCLEQSLPLPQIAISPLR